MTKWTTMREQAGALLEELKYSSQAVVSVDKIPNILLPGQLCAVLYIRREETAAFRRMAVLGFKYAASTAEHDKKSRVVGYIHLKSNSERFIEPLIRKRAIDGVSFVEIQAFYEQSRQIPLFIRQVKSLNTEKILDDLRELKRRHGLDMAIIHGFDDRNAEDNIFDTLKAFAKEIDVKIVCSFAINSEAADMHSINSTSNIDLLLKPQPLGENFEVLKS